MASGFSQLLKKPIPLALIFMALAMTLINLDHRNWQRDRVIEWDVKSYYAYLPAVFIYQDLSLEFIDNDREKLGDLIWPIQTPTGKRAIITTMGMSVLYMPFFLMAHVYANLTGWEADGYSIPYRVALNFSVLFYVLAGMWFLSRLLLKHFSQKVTALTLLALGMGTNLLYYTTHEGAMSHGYNFALIALFLWLTHRFHEGERSLGHIVWLGLLAGFITLVRPTNIIVLVLFFLWGVDSWKAFSLRVEWFARRWYFVLVMALFFVLAWVPQFLYWHWVSGQLFFFTYGEEGGGFFWHNPQVFNILFSYKKGWFVYTPIMFFAFLSIFLLPFIKTQNSTPLRGLFAPILIYKLLNIYILASWWSWWFGGGFGLRAFVDSYAVLAIPLAALISLAVKQKKNIHYPAVGLLILLLWFNFFQIQQYRRMAIHYWWMNKEAYWETFLKKRPTERYWELITIPDYEKARQGIYVAIQPGQDSNKAETETGEDTASDLAFPNNNKEMDHSPEEREQQLLRIETRLRGDSAMAAFIREKALKEGVPADTMFRRDALWYYKRGE